MSRILFRDKTHLNGIAREQTTICAAILANEREKGENESNDDKLWYYKYYKT